MSELGFGMIDFREVVKSIRIKTVIRLMNQNNPLSNLLRSNISSSWINIKSLGSTRQCLDQAIKDMGILWKNTFKNCDINVRDDLVKIIGQEYVGNILEKRYLNKRLGLLHRNNLNITDTSHP